MSRYLYHELPIYVEVYCHWDTTATLFLSVSNTILISSNDHRSYGKGVCSWANIMLAPSGIDPCTCVRYSYLIELCSRSARYVAHLARNESLLLPSKQITPIVAIVHITSWWLLQASLSDIVTIRAFFCPLHDARDVVESTKKHSK